MSTIENVGLQTNKIDKRWKEEYARIKADVSKQEYNNIEEKIVYLLYHIVALLCKLLYK